MILTMRILLPDLDSIIRNGAEEGTDWPMCYSALEEAIDCDRQLLEGRHRRQFAGVLGAIRYGYAIAPVGAHV